MSKGDIKITVSGGSANFSNVSHGDHNELDSTQKNHVSINNDDFSQFYQAIAIVSEANNIEAQEVEALKQEVKNLEKRLDEKGIVDIIKKIYEKYSWAIKPLEKLFSVLMP